VQKPVAPLQAHPICQVWASRSWLFRRAPTLILSMLKAKLHGATVTQCDLYYEGSVSIDQDLLDASGILAHEKVDIWNVTNGARITTYALEAPRGSRTIGVNGAAARHFAVGDNVIIAAFCGVEADKARQHAPTVVLLDGENGIRRPA
jgi:aspartate 1-decarboxylase